MKALLHVETSVFQALFNWGADLVSRDAAAMKPEHRANQIAAVVAASGNPSGA